MLWIYNFSNWQMCLIITSVFVACALVGLRLTRKWVQKHCYNAFADHNEAVSAFIGTYGVFFGITLGLIAVATWENYEAANEVVDREAAAIEALYRDVSAFPEPARAELRKRLRTYVDFIIDVAWHEHKRGIIPVKGLRLATNFEAELFKFDPKTMRDQVVFHETLDQYNEMLTLRQSRLDEVEEGLPDILWWVVLAGSVLNIALVYLIHIEPARTHYLLIGLLAAFIGLMVFLIVALDHPFRGEFSIGSGPFEQLREGWRELEAAKLD